MKKLLSLGLTLLLAAGCTSSPADNQSAYELYSAAVKRSSEAKKIAAKMETKLSMTVEEETMDMNMTMDLALDQSDSTQPKFTMETTTESLGTALTVNTYYLDNNFYMDLFGQKLKTEIDFSEVLDQTASLTEQANIFSEEDFKEAAITKEGDTTVLTLEPSEALQKKLSQQALEQAEVENSELSFGDTQIQIKLNKAGDFEEIFFEVPVSITVENEKMEMSYATHMYYTGFDDQVTLNFPDDLADYQSADLDLELE